MFSEAVVDMRVVTLRDQGLATTEGGYGLEL
jgi:hypothetical protein